MRSPSAQLLASLFMFGVTSVASAQTPTLLNGLTLNCSTPFSSQSYTFGKAGSDDVVVAVEGTTRFSPYTRKSIAFYTYKDGIISMDLYPGNAEVKMDLNTFTNGLREKTVEHCNATDVGGSLCTKVTQTCSFAF